MSTGNQVSTAAGILNKGRKPVVRGAVVSDASAVLNKTAQPSGTPNPTPNFATEVPDTNPPDASIPITNLVDLFNAKLISG